MVQWLSWDWLLPVSRAVARTEGSFQKYSRLLPIHSAPSSKQLRNIISQQVAVLWSCCWCVWSGSLSGKWGVGEASRQNSVSALGFLDQHMADITVLNKFCLALCSLSLILFMYTMCVCGRALKWWLLLNLHRTWIEVCLEGLLLTNLTDLYSGH